MKKSLKELFPSEVNSNKLHKDNHFYRWPLSDFSGAEGYKAGPGCVIRGWSSHPPYDGGYPTVLVVERLEPLKDSSGNTLEEPGFYWYHWPADKKDFAIPEGHPLTKKSKRERVSA